MHFCLSFFMFVFLSSSAFAQNDEWQRTEAPPNAHVYIISPSDGSTVKGPFKVQFGLTGIGVAPSGVEYPDSGHHHLLVNREITNFDEPLPSGDSDLLHYGGGQTEAILELDPGKYTLQLILGDHDHVPHLPPVLSDKIDIKVE